MEIKTRKNTHFKYKCKKCDYNSNNKTDYKRHLQTIKHLETSGNKQKKELKCDCGKIYKTNSGLWKHKKKCSFANTDISKNAIFKTELIQEKDKELTDIKSMFMKMMNSNKELQQIIFQQNEKLEKQNEKLIELAKQPKTINNINSNNTFNLENFLNIQCKDAMNLTDFVESIQLTFKDLLYLGDNGFVKSIQNTFVKQLKDMEQNKRPIHCTDKKRKTIYIKDENEWNKDANHKQVNNAISSINKKQYKTLSEWFKDNPEWNTSGNIQMSCMEIMSKLNGLDEEDGEKNKKKIVNKIVENIILDKE